MKNSLLLIAIVGASIAVSPSGQAASPSSVVIYPAAESVKWDGWGTSLAWWAKNFGDRDDIADVLFTTRIVMLEGQTLPGLGLNIVRYNAGACSWNEVDGRRIVDAQISPVRRMEGFWLDGKSDDPQSPSWNWAVDANQRAMMAKAHARGATGFELFSNSPMWWMCGNDNPSGAAVATDDNLPPRNEKAFAVYLATIARQAKDHWGITFTNVEPFNEPLGNWWFAGCHQEGCHFSPESQARVLKLLRAELDSRGLRDMPIAASDNNSYTQGISNWKSFDAATKGVVAEINVHGYQADNIPDREALAQAAQADGKQLWNTEYGGADATGLDLATAIDLDFRHLHPTAWCYWQGLDGKGWGLLPTDLETKKIGAANPKYFVLAHYSRHIRPGMTILACDTPGTVAAYDATGKKLVIVTLNNGPARTFSYDLSRFAGATGPITRWMTEPLGQTRYEKHSDLALTNGRFVCSFPAKSIQTFEVENIGATAAR